MRTKSLCSSGRASATTAAALTIASLALLGGTAHAQVPVLTNLFRVQAGSIYDLVLTGNNNRGITISPVTGNILYTSTAASSNHVSILDGKTGQFIKALDANGVSGGTLSLLAVRVAADGAVYAANLAAATSNLRIYRWESEDDPNPPLLVMESYNSPVRLGDAFDLRGSGTNTQMAIAGTASANQWVIVTPDPTDAFLTNAPWIPTFLPFPAGVAGGDLGNGISFDGTNNAIYAKKGGSSLIRHIGFDLAAQTNWLIRSIDTAQTRFVGTKFYETNGVKLVAGVMYGSGTALGAQEHRARVYDISNPAAVTPVLDDPMPGPYSANGNGIAASDIFGSKLAVIEPNNGIAVYSVQLISALAPTIASQPAGISNILQGGYYTLSVSVSGSSPFGYQWKFNGADIPGATNRVLDFTYLDLTNTGIYTVTVTNSVGKATSEGAYIGVVPSAQDRTAQITWSKKPGEQFFLTTDNTQRGLAYNPISGNLVLVSRAPSNGVHVVNSTTGAYIRSLDMTGVELSPGAVYVVNMVAVADDGAVYVCNLTTDGSGFTIYRWPDDQGGTAPAIIYQDNPMVGRIGDTFAAKGSGLGTVLLAASRNGTQVAAFTPLDPSTWTARVVDVASAPAGFAGLGLFATSTNTFFAKSADNPLFEVQFDLEAGTNNVVLQLDSPTNSINVLGVDAANKLMFGINNVQTPKNLSVFDFYKPGVAALIDQDWFGTSFENANGTGQIAVDLAGGRVFALNSNNGLLALKYAPPLRTSVEGGKLVLRWAGPAILVSSPNAAGPYLPVQGAVSGVYTNTADTTTFYRLTRSP